MQSAIISCPTTKIKATILHINQCFWSKKPPKLFTPRLWADHHSTTTHKLRTARQTLSIQTRTSHESIKTAMKCSKWSSSNRSNFKNNSSNIHMITCRQDRIKTWCSSCLDLLFLNSQTTSQVLRTSKLILRFWLRPLLMRSHKDMVVRMIMDIMKKKAALMSLMTSQNP